MKVGEYIKLDLGTTRSFRTNKGNVIQNGDSYEILQITDTHVVINDGYNSKVNRKLVTFDLQKTRINKLLSLK